MLVAPCSIGCFRRFGKGVFATPEDHHEDRVWVLGLKQKHLLPISRRETSFGLYDHVGIGDVEVGQISPLLLRLDVRELL